MEKRIKGQTTTNERSIFAVTKSDGEIKIGW